MRVEEILGIDPGIGCTGYGVVQSGAGGCLALKTFGEIRTAPGDPFPRRLKALFDGLIAVVSRDAPTQVAIEETFLARNFQAALKLGQARGVALLVAEIHRLPVFEYSPTAVKVAVVGYGRASKDQIGVMARRILNLPAETQMGEHAADALAIAVCHAHSAGLLEKMGASCAPRITPR